METYYFDQLSRSWVYSTNGAKLPKTAYPAIGLEDKKWLEIHVVTVSNSVVTPVDLSTFDIQSLHVAVDTDFNSNTDPMCRTNAAPNYDLTQLSNGIIGFLLDGETASFLSKVNGQKRKSAYMQIKGYDSGGERVLNLTPNWKATDYSIICEGDIDPNTGELPGLSENYSTTAEMNAIIATPPVIQFSVDGAALWHSTQVDADRYYRESRNGGEWSDAIALVVGATGDSAYVYVAYASDDTGSDWNLTPSDILKYRAEIHSATELTPVVGDFSAATWVKYLGIDGEDGDNGTGVAPQGEYAGGTTYALNEGVTYDGSYYRSKVADNTGNQPDTSPAEWELMISSIKGDTGATGATNTCFVTAPSYDTTLDCVVFPLDDVNAALKTDRMPSISNLKANIVSANSSFTGNIVIYTSTGRTALTQAGWTASTGVSGAYYRSTAPGTEPTFTTEDTSLLKKVADTASLVAGSWCWDDGDTLGYDTLYVYPNTGNTPTTDGDGFYQYDITASQTIAVGATEAEKTITISSASPVNIELWRDTYDTNDTLVDGSSVPVSAYFTTLEYKK